MKIPPMIAAELRRLTSSRMAILALVALVAVPIIYGGLYLWANHDPYSELDQVPVALVVDDEGTGTGDDYVNHGDEVADELLEQGDFDWHRVSAGTAAAGVDDSTYDFSLTFPADFSSSLASAATTDPHQATVTLTTNDANSYLASTIGEQATARIQKTIVQQTNQEASIQFLSALATIREKLQDAADGAGDLGDGATKLSTGAASAIDGTQKLQDGAGQLGDGASALSTGASSLAGGLDSLASGVGTLQSGASSLASGASSLASSSSDLADGAAKVAAGNDQVAGIADQAGAAAASAVDRLPEIRADLESRLKDQDVPQETIDRILSTLDPLADDVAAGNEKVQGVVAQLDALASGADDVAAGASKLSDGADSLSDGADSVSAGVGSVAGGVSKLQDGAGQLESGLGTLQGGIGDLQGGLSDLHGGLDTLHTGLGTLGDGIDSLQSGLEKGVDSIPDTTAAQRTAQAKTIADPIHVTQPTVTSAGTYGAGLAPFFASLAAWIGIYALFLIVKPVSRRAITALHSPIKVTLAGWLTPGILGLVQMSALYVVLAYALKFDIAHPFGTLGVMMLASLTFAAIILTLNVWLGSVGQFLGLVLMVVQLVTAGGTFPWQTLPGPLAALHHVLPMSYAVDAMRQLMYGGDISRAGSDCLVLAGFLLGALVISAIGVTRMTHHRTLRDLRPSLIG